MANPFQPEYLILHDYGRSPGAAPSFNPYHALVSGGRVNYRDPKNPYGAPAPHAYKLNPKSIGLSWGGKVGGMPSKEEFALIKQEFDAIKKQFPNIKVMSHGEAYQQTRGTGQQASRSGRGLEEASWRKYLLENTPYEPGTVAPSGPTPMGQRSLTAYAGVQKTQPSTTGTPQPMPTYKNVGGQQFMGPETAQNSQKLAQMLINQGMEQQPMTHWTQALGKVLMTGSGALRNDMAMRDVREGQAAGNNALASMLMGGDAQAAMTNPYSADSALQYQQQQKIMADRNAAAERLQRSKIDAQNADPMRMLKMENLQSQIDARRAGSMAKSAPMSVGQQALDRNFAKVYSEDIASGKLNDAISQLQTLDNIANQLTAKDAPNVTGPMLGMVPESVRAFTNPKSVDIQNEIANVVQRSLRPILGSQFTEREGENLIKRAYNPQLPEAENAKRLKRLVAVSKKIAEQKLATAKFFEENRGTLANYPASQNFSVADIEAAMDAIEPPPSAQGGGMQMPAINVPQGGDGQLPVISDPAQARGLPKGTRFKTPDGRVMEVP